MCVCVCVLVPSSSDVCFKCAPLDVGSRGRREREHERRGAQQRKTLACSLVRSLAHSRTQFK